MNTHIMGITRVRNEQEILQDALDHAGRFCDGIVVYDDCSDDDTARIAEAHPKVRVLIRGAEWESRPERRHALEGKHRFLAFQAAREFNSEWVYCFDADERLEIEGPLEADGSVTGLRFRLWDHYITAEDAHLPYTRRRWIGPEYRDILMMFRPRQVTSYLDREPNMIGRVVQARGSVRHYGKAVSVEQFEATCRYYAEHYEHAGWAEKWRRRMGGAIHTASDFGRELILWEQRHTHGVPLVD